MSFCINLWDFPVDAPTQPRPVEAISLWVIVCACSFTGKGVYGRQCSSSSTSSIKVPSSSTMPAQRCHTSNTFWFCWAARCWLISVSPFWRELNSLCRSSKSAIAPPAPLVRLALTIPLSPLVPNNPPNEDSCQRRARSFCQTYSWNTLKKKKMNFKNKAVTLGQEQKWRIDRHLGVKPMWLLYWNDGWNLKLTSLPSHSDFLF